MAIRWKLDNPLIHGVKTILGKQTWRCRIAGLSFNLNGDIEEIGSQSIHEVSNSHVAEKFYIKEGKMLKFRATKGR